MSDKRKQHWAEIKQYISMTQILKGTEFWDLDESKKGLDRILPALVQRPGVQEKCKRLSGNQEPFLWRAFQLDFSEATGKNSLALRLLSCWELKVQLLHCGEQRRQQCLPTCHHMMSRIVQVCSPFSEKDIYLCSPSQRGSHNTRDAKLLSVYCTLIRLNRHIKLNANINWIEPQDSGFSRENTITFLKIKNLTKIFGQKLLKLRDSYKPQDLV